MSDPSTSVVILLLGIAIGAGTALYLLNQHSQHDPVWDPRFPHRQDTPKRNRLSVHVHGCNSASAPTSFHEAQEKQQDVSAGREYGGRRPGTPPPWRHDR